jgi:hypothetical protein
MLLSSLGVLAQNITEMTAKLRMTAIRSMFIREEQLPSRYLLDVRAEINNDNAEAIRLQKGQFDVTIQEAGGNPVQLGTTGFTQQDLANGGNSVSFVVDMGPTTSTTVSKMIYLFNLVGSQELRMVIRGTAEVGLKLPNGWFYEPGRRFGVELHFQPEMRREVLLK